MISDILFSIIFIVPSIVIASTIHEFAHAWSAYVLGDDTAKLYGRLTLNPISHIDPIGFLTMIITGGRFGWSKPVPINERNFNINPVMGTAITAIAGPLSNLFMAFVAGSFYRLLTVFNILSSDSIIGVFILIFTMINISLMLFNLIPFPPLDGSRIVRVLLPYQLRLKWEEIERILPFFFILLIFTFGSPLQNILGSVLNSILYFLTGSTI